MNIKIKCDICYVKGEKPKRLAKEKGKINLKKYKMTKKEVENQIAWSKKMKEKRQAKMKTTELKLTEKEKLQKWHISHLKQEWERVNRTECPKNMRKVELINNLLRK